MSGIEKMKNKIKNKMTIEDLPSPTKKNDKGTHAVHTAVQEDVSTTVNKAEKEEQKAKEPTKSPFHQMQDNNVAQNVTYIQPNVQQNVSAANYQTQYRTAKNEIQTKKVTLYLTEEMYIAFNEIYARRILEGRKTDKSGLINEAVALLLKSENERSNS
jgi:hypothetical protein